VPGVEVLAAEAPAGAGCRGRCGRRGPSPRRGSGGGRSRRCARGCGPRRRAWCSRRRASPWPRPPARRGPAPRPRARSSALAPGLQGRCGVRGYFCRAGRGHGGAGLSWRRPRQHSPILLRGLSRAGRARPGAPRRWCASWAAANPCRAHGAAATPTGAGPRRSEAVGGLRTSAARSPSRPGSSSPKARRMSRAASRPARSGGLAELGPQHLSALGPQHRRGGAPSPWRRARSSRPVVRAAAGRPPGRSRPRRRRAG
jgi:hypothetical protein